jgi:hypothetical protein
VLQALVIAHTELTAQAAEGPLLAAHSQTLPVSLLYLPQSKQT